MFFRKNKTQSKTKITSLLIGLGLCFLLKPNVTTHAANSGYVLGVAPDFERFVYQAIITTEEHDVRPDGYSEFESFNMKPEDIDKGGIPLKFSDSGWDKSKKGSCKDAAYNSILNNYTFSNCTAFLFPANNSNAAFSGPDDKDSQAITRVTSQVLTQLNQAISFVMSHAEKDGKSLVSQKLSSAEKKELFAKITGELGNHSIGMKGKSSYSKTFTIEDTTFRIKKKSSSSSFLILSVEGTNTKTELRYRIQKYPEGTTEGTDDYDRSGNHPTIYWAHLVWWGNANYVHRQVEGTNISELGSEGFIAESIYWLLNQALNGLRIILGIDAIEDIVFNQGNFKMTNWRGIAPTEWFEAGNILMWICQIIAWLTLALALVWRFGSTMWGTVTTFKYVTLVESIKDIFVASITTSLIYPIFMTLTNFNVLLVDIMANLTYYNDKISAATVGGGTVAGILVSILFFGIEVYFNFVYLLRGITIVLLYGLAPMFFMVYAFGGNMKSITMRYVKELIGNIFIHTFHATFLAFFAIFMNTAKTGFFTQIVLLYAFIPMTKLFKSLTGIGESDFISNTAEQAKDTFKSAGNAVAGGVVGGVVGGITASKMKGSKGGGDNGGGGGDSYKGDSLSSGFGGDTAKGSLTGRLAKTVGNKISNSKMVQGSEKLSKAVDIAKKGASLTAKGVSKAKSLYNSAGGQMLAGAAKGVAGAALAGSGAILGNNQLSKAGQNMATNGISGSIHSGKELASNIEERIHGREIQTDDPTHIGGYLNEDGSRTDTYDAQALADTGIENMDMFKDQDGDVVMRQKIDASKLSDSDQRFLENVETDLHGNVKSKELQSLGLKNVKRTSDGKYIVQYDARKRGLNNLKRSGNKFILNQHESNNASLNHLGDIKWQYQENNRAEKRQQAAQERVTERQKMNAAAEQRQREAQERVNQRAEQQAKKVAGSDLANVLNNLNNARNDGLNGDNN